jgi:hypothetical protein
MSDSFIGGPTDPDKAVNFCKTAGVNPVGGRLMLGSVSFALRVSGGVVGPSARWEVATDGDTACSPETFEKLKEGSAVGGYVLHDRRRYALVRVGEGADRFAELLPT